jgi:hypothetical protein
VRWPRLRTWWQLAGRQPKRPEAPQLARWQADDQAAGQAEEHSAERSECALGAGGGAA